MTLSEGMENIQQPPFLVDVKTGGVYLNFDPQRGMKGYFDFMVHSQALPSFFSQKIMFIV